MASELSSRVELLAAKFAHVHLFPDRLVIINGALHWVVRALGVAIVLLLKGLDRLNDLLLE